LLTTIQIWKKAYVHIFYNILESKLPSGKDKYSESRSTPQQEKFKEENKTRELQLRLNHERECLELELEQHRKKEVLVHDTEMKKLHFAALDLYNKKKDPEPIYPYATLAQIGTRICLAAMFFMCVYCGRNATKQR